MKYRDDELRSDISDIKHDISILKTKVNLIIQNLDLKDSSQVLVISTQESSSSSISELTQITEAQIDISRESVADTNFFLIDPSFARTEELKESIIQYDQQMNSSKTRKEFIQFCFLAIKLVEEFISHFINRKFQELLEESNKDILDGCLLLEQKYKEYREKNTEENRERTFKSIDVVYVKRDTCDDSEAFYYYADRGEYLSLNHLREKLTLAVSIDLCFAILYREEFYNPRSSDINKKRPPKPVTRSARALNSISSVNKIRMDYYYKLSSARKFRNAYAHPREDKSFESDKEYQNYDGILDAVRWFIQRL